MLARHLLLVMQEGATHISGHLEFSPAGWAGPKPDININININIANSSLALLWPIDTGHESTALHSVNTNLITVFSICMG